MSFASDKVTTGTYNFVTFVLNLAPEGSAISGLAPCAVLAVISAKTQFLE